MSKWFLPLVLLYSSTLFVITSGQCSRSCEPCSNRVNCLRCSAFISGSCVHGSIYFSNSERICGTDCSLCCAGSPYLRRQCMRTANGVELDSAATCWRLYAFLPTTSSHSASTTRRWSSNSAPAHRTYSSNQDLENEETNDGAVWRGAVIAVVALVVLAVILKRYSPCFRIQTLSQDFEEEEEPITTQVSSDGVPVSGKNAKSEVVVVVAPDGEVDVGLKD